MHQTEPPEENLELMKECPCGSVFPYTDCCGPLIRGATPADTAEDLMRSRYSATVLAEKDYLRKTLHPDERPPEDAPETEAGENSLEWTGLSVIGKKKGERQDADGEVRFVAHYKEAGLDKTHREDSRFVKVDGQWFYSQKGSQVHRAEKAPAKPPKPFVREGAKIGRNDPCPCGSGKKYKKCCGG